MLVCSTDYYTCYVCSTDYYVYSTCICSTDYYVCSIAGATVQVTVCDYVERFMRPQRMDALGNGTHVHIMLLHVLASTLYMKLSIP